MRDATVSSGMLDNSGYAARHRDARPTVRQQDDRACRAAWPTRSRASSSARWAAPRRRRRRCPRPRLPAGASASAAAAPTPLSQTQSDFVQTHQTAALAAQAQTGIPAAFMIGQAAHESGWGKRAIKNADGSDSHNLFGRQGWRRLDRADDRNHHHRIRRRPGAEGEREVPRLRRPTPMRFSDYARMLKDSPRYAGVAAQAAQAPARRRLGEQLRARPATRRLRHRPGLRRQAGARHQHDVAGAEASA